VVPDRGPALPDRLTEDSSDLLRQPGGFRGVDRSAGSGGVDPGGVEGLVGVDVPDPGQHPLIEEGDLHRPAGPTQTLVQPRTGDPGRVGSEIAQQAVAEVLRIAGDVDAAEPARVDELEAMDPILGVDRPDHVTMGRHRSSSGGVDQIEPTGHAQPDHHAACVEGRVVEGHDQLLAAATHRRDPAIPAEQSGLDPTPAPALGVPHHVPAGDPHADHATPREHGLDASSDRFDFGEFRHAGNHPGPGEAATILGPAPVSAGRAAFRSRVATARVATPKTGTTMTDSMLHQEDPVAAAAAVRTVADRIRAEVGKVIVGQEEVLEEVLLAIFCGGHAIIEGVPGLAKTLLVHSLASTLGLEFSRIQFTPDLMPTDMTGTEVIEEDRTTGRRELRFVPGPIFANVILADEINRTPPKTQGALLEAMQERQVTVGGQTHVLPSPFFVLATQNPIEQEGTYPLPEAQLDRFMFNIRIGYPTEADELAIVQRTTATTHATLESVLDAADCLRIQQLVREVPIADHVARYALRLVRATRVRESRDDKPEIVRDYLAWGAGPRASQFLVLAAKAMALVTGSTHVTPELIRAVALPVMRHRIIANFNAEADGVSTDDVIRGLLDTIPVDESDPATRSTLDSVTR